VQYVAGSTVSVLPPIPSSIQVYPRLNASNAVAPFSPSASFIFYLVNCTGYHALPITANLVHNALFRRSTGDGAASIWTAVHPLPFTATQQVIVSAANGFSIAIITAIAFVFIPASYAVFVVREREVKAKHLQTISGVSQLAYWTSTYVWDLCNYIFPFVGSIIVVAAYNNSNFTGSNFGVTIMAFLLYGFSVAPFTYLCSFAFKSHSTAQTVLILVYFITGLLFLITSFSLVSAPHARRRVSTPLHRSQTLSRSSPIADSSVCPVRVRAPLLLWVLHSL
jgi:hypothetical protein